MRSLRNSDNGLTKMTDAQTFANSRKAAVVAPAGCGKTQLIAQAVAQNNSGRDLVLTHTHAGVNALRGRLDQLNVPKSAYHVVTIAGLALRYCASFPTLSGITTKEPSGDDWTEIYKLAAQLLQRPAVKEILRSSYSGVYVDEYQDCTVAQHWLVSAISEVMPCRIVGDPLQRIFQFSKDQLISWEEHVTPDFEDLPQLTTPWRWDNANSELGTWLTDVRRDLLAGKPIDLTNTPPSVTWKKIPSKGSANEEQRKACWSAQNRAGSVVAILEHEAQCNSLARTLGGSYSPVEAIESRDLFKFAKIIDHSTGLQRANAIPDFAACCLTKVKSELNTGFKVLEKGLSKKQTYKHQAQIDALKAVIESSSLTPVVNALDKLRAIPGAKLYRRELFDEM